MQIVARGFSATPDWDIVSYLLKVANFSYPACSLSQLEVIPSEYHRHLASENLRVPVLPLDVIYVMIHLAVLIEHQLMMDTNIQGHSIHCTSMASCGKSQMSWVLDTVNGIILILEDPLPFSITYPSRVSTTSGNTGNLEFLFPVNTGNLLEFNWFSWKFLNDGMMTKESSRKN